MVRQPMERGRSGPPAERSAPSSIVTQTAWMRRSQSRLDAQIGRQNGRRMTEKVEAAVDDPFGQTSACRRWIFQSGQFAFGQIVRSSDAIRNDRSVSDWVRSSNRPATPAICALRPSKVSASNGCNAPICDIGRGAERKTFLIPSCARGAPPSLAAAGSNSPPRC